MAKKSMPRDQQMLLKKALKGLNDFAKEGKVRFTPANKRESVRDESKN